MYIVDESIQNKSGPHGDQKLTTTDSETNNLVENSEDYEDFNELGSKSDSRYEPKSAPLGLLYYPEKTHLVIPTECHQFNSRIMKHIMNQKMSKNATFTGSKIY